MREKRKKNVIERERVQNIFSECNHGIFATAEQIKKTTDFVDDMRYFSFC